MNDKPLTVRPAELLSAVLYCPRCRQSVLVRVADPAVALNSAGAASLLVWKMKVHRCPRVWSINEFFGEFEDSEDDPSMQGIFEREMDDVLGPPPAAPS